MAAFNRRRFLAITASAALAGGPVRAGTFRQFSGTGLGARMTITLDHPDAKRIALRAFGEVDRLEDIFSLYRSASALSRLNRHGTLESPPFELLECLSLCGAAHRATGGLFDPTVQPLWQLYAESFSSGRAPKEREIRSKTRLVGWRAVRIGPARVQLPPGAALTLNGIAQGYVADRVAKLLRAMGLTRILIDTGEIAALGGRWPVRIDASPTPAPVLLRDQALASSAPLGTAFVAEGRVGHILDPRTGRPAAPIWRIVSVTASSAAFADALSTAAVLMEKPAMDAMFATYPAELVLAVPSAAPGRFQNVARTGG